MPRIVVDSVHLDQIREHGGLAGLRDENALEAALARAHQRWNYEPASDLAELAAAYAFGLVRAHAFNDGNKRIAFLTMAVFLGLNGKELGATEEEVVQIVVSLAEGSLSESEFAGWLRPRLTRLRLS